ncbi:TPA: hypothetical protein N0F65_009957 [Lagenidium giganteum]|uniref:FCP1 homology domain-containing protein n=1 Tax=Lagenidium giganteum TaxID=4803 RepID=A0AAV2YW50_9STRA|nr:TPA: hypothetical protein N0F65_009957 [Lagenidium giganteum]
MSATVAQYPHVARTRFGDDVSHAKKIGAQVRSPSVTVAPGRSSLKPLSYTATEDASSDKKTTEPVEEERIALVLDMDECLVHSKFQNEVEYRQAENRPTDIRTYEDSFEIVMDDGERAIVNKRPGLDRFLEEANKHFDLYVFTAGLEAYGKPILDVLDPKGTLFAGRFFRESCQLRKGMFLKDLRVVRRDLSRVILVDNNPVSFLTQPSNGIPVPSFYDDAADRTLESLTKVLSSLRDLDDVPSVPITEIRTRKWTKQVKTVGHLTLLKWHPTAALQQGAFKKTKGRRRGMGEVGRMTRSVRQHLDAPLDIFAEIPAPPPRTSHRSSAAATAAAAAAAAAATTAVTPPAVAPTPSPIERAAPVATAATPVAAAPSILPTAAPSEPAAPSVNAAQSVPSVVAPTETTQELLPQLPVVVSPMSKTAPSTTSATPEAGAMAISPATASAQPTEEDSDDGSDSSSSDDGNDSANTASPHPSPSPAPSPASSQMFSRSPSPT